MVKVGGAEIHVIERGAGQPVLFLHGNPDSAAMWSSVIDRVSNQFRCIAPDLPGFGASGVPAGFDPSLEGMARFVAEFVAAYGLATPVDLVVHDIGGPFGLAWAIRHPERVRRIVVTNMNFFSDYRWHLWGRIWRTPGLGELSMALMNRLMFVHEMQRQRSGLNAEHLRATYDRITPAMKRMVLRLYRAADSANFVGWESDLLKLTARTPTCVLWGDRDPYIEPRFADRFGARDVHHYPNHGHWLAVEAPDEVASRLRAFLGRA